MTHHKTWFPLIVVALSALLGVFIYSAYKDRLETPEPTSVTAVEYQAAVQQAVGGLETKLAAAADDQARVNLLSSARDQLLSTLVPADYKDVHLEMVMTLTQWIAGYQGDPQKQAAAKERWQTIVTQYSFVQ